ncbi:MAG: KH domain-containing protein [Bacilli bacterium]|nr:KH domain-containing protein [Bacilli bacterium]
MEKYVFSGKTEEEALENAMSELSVEKNDILYDVKEQKGGLFKGKKIELTVTKKSDINNFIKETVLKIVNDMGFDVQIETKVRDDILNLTIHSDNNNLLIGRDGKNMNALSVVVKQIIQNELGQFYKFNLDVGEYKLKQQKNLERMAKRVAREVAKSKIEVKLDPMNSYERRIIHNVLNDDKYVYTESTGEEPNRCVVIKIRND